MADRVEIVETPTTVTTDPESAPEPSRPGGWGPSSDPGPRRGPHRGPSTDPSHPAESESDPESTSARSRKGIGGPRTPEGKARSARNAIKHGLRAETQFPEELERRAEELALQFAADLRPETPYQVWLLRRAALGAAKIERIEQLQLVAHTERVRRAETSWDLERRLAVEELGAKLSKDPARVRATLGVTRQGVEWLIARWEALGMILKRRGAWDDAQRRLALDLLGTPPDLRDGSPHLNDGSTREDLERLVARQLNGLRTELATHAGPRDARERELARRGCFLHDDPTGRSLRRYEAETTRAVNRAFRDFFQAHKRTAAEPTPGGTARRSPRPAYPGRPRRFTDEEVARGRAAVAAEGEARAAAERAAAAGISPPPSGSRPPDPPLWFPGEMLPTTAPWYDLERVADDHDKAMRAIELTKAQSPPLNRQARRRLARQNGRAPNSP